eukprot:4949372-Prymnesium_polylepis.2
MFDSTCRFDKSVHATCVTVSGGAAGGGAAGGGGVGGGGTCGGDAGAGGAGGSGRHGGKTASVAQARREGARVLLSARTYPDIMQSEMCRDDTAPAGCEHRSSGL